MINDILCLYVCSLRRKGKIVPMYNMTYYGAIIIYLDGIGSSKLDVGDQTCSHVDYGNVWVSKPQV
jgi:hypothetical protein